MSTPLISVVVPAHNREKYIRRSLNSVLRQTYSNIEVIVVDDMSSDNTVDVALGLNDPRMRIIRHEKNLGASGARNSGIDAAQGQLIAFQDTDDVWLPNKLEKQLKCLQAHPKSKFSFGAFIRISGKTAEIIASIPECDVGQLFSLMLKENLVTPQTILADAAFMKAHGKFDTNLIRYEDWDLGLRVFELTTIAYDSEPLVIAYNTPGSLSSNVLQDGVARKLIATKHFSKFVKHKDCLAFNYAEAGHSFTCSGKYLEALDCFLRALRWSPASTAVWWRLLKASTRTVYKKGT